MSSEKITDNEAFNAALAYPRLTVEVEFSHPGVNAELLKEAQRLWPELLAPNSENKIIFKDTNFILFEKIERLCRRAEINYNNTCSGSKLDQKEKNT